MTKMIQHCATCGCILERVRYFPRQIITADDMTVQSRYFIERMRRQNRLLHGWGVVCGCAVEPVPDDDHPWLIRVCPGYLLTPQGDEVAFCEAVNFDLARCCLEPEDPCAKTWPCPPVQVSAPHDETSFVYLAVRYVECVTRPVRVDPLGCGCDTQGCEYSRLRDDFELGLLWELPKSHSAGKLILVKVPVESDKGNSPAQPGGPPAPQEQQQHLQKQQAIAQQQQQHHQGPQHPPELAPCPECPEDPWVVLARIKLPNKPTTKVAANDIDYTARRTLPSVSALASASAHA